ncbi:FecR family protein [Pseudomonas sp. 21LCFQ02]|uniref:FecR family protein n=1 Tax=unclassified Pseudomonas TaxID=196821 RepID=UPI00209AFCD4|nr:MULTISPECIES: FecR family protein [unclassified Pseudomonas]MCO8168024.1 FecR family protein [Pseudomonas sp. 21LCFQ02]MCQ9423272.1 FecR family protein [Pseudomonas sp. LJDD11]
MHQTTSSQVSDDAIIETAAQWFMRLQEDDCTDVERHQFTQWLAADPRHAREYQAMGGTWAACEGLKPAITAPVSPVADNAAPPGSRPRRHRQVFLFAAASAMALLVGWHQGWIPSQYESQQADKNTRIVTLPDGSRVELNINTRLTYTGYRDRRIISLDKGEAFFEVARDALHPFIVQAGQGSIEATGTRFNVWLYQQQVQVMLVEGSVQVVSDRAHPEHSVQLRPGMQAGYQAGDTQPTISHSRTADTSLAWRYGKLVFNDLPLRLALPLINRYLSTPVMLADSATGDLRLGLNYNTREMSALVNALPQVLPVQIIPNAQGNPVLYRQPATPPRS